MTILLPRAVAQRLVVALHDAAEREIGGVLLGEHVAEGVFRIVDLTIQKRGGTFATFVRLLDNALQAIRVFFQHTKHDYLRFNYLGEWHSHPSFAPTPSDKDDRSMMEIVRDPDVGALFVVLMIVKLSDSELVTTATVYTPAAVSSASVVREEHEAARI
jgi:[CysO sulfur-carrier protein]-S-L-cysteine hydrolase